MDPLLVTGGRYGADSKQHRGMHSLPELSDRYQSRWRIVGGRRVYEEEMRNIQGGTGRSASAMGSAAASWLSGEDEDAWVRRAVRNQTHDLKAAFRTADRQQRHRHNPRSVVQIMERESGALPAAQVRSILAQRGIPFTDGYWAHLCAYCAAPGTSAGVAGAPLTYARLLNRYLRESDPQRMEGALSEVSGRYCTVHEAQEMIRRSIMLKIRGGPSELRRAFTHFDTDGSGTISKAEFKEALKMKANLVLDNTLLDLVLEAYNDDGSGVIDYRKFCERVMGSGADDSTSGLAHKPSGSKDDAHAMFSRKMRLGFREMKFQLGKRYPTGELTPAQLNQVLQRFDVTIGHQNLVDMLKECGAFSRKTQGAVQWPLFLNAVIKGQHSEASDSIAPLSSRWISLNGAKEMIRTKICAAVSSGPSEERRAFQMIDADGSGHLDLAEFKEALKTRANLVLEDDLMAAVWRSYDDNNNGILDYRKFIQQVLQAPQYASSNAQRGDPPKEADLGDGHGGGVLPPIAQDMSSPVGAGPAGVKFVKGGRQGGGAGRNRGGGRGGGAAAAKKRRGGGGGGGGGGRGGGGGGGGRR
jgi:Ca2+-binding EF-hand superfamily protein